LPPDAAATPAAGTLRESRLLNAPRGLNEPVCCRNSSFSGEWRAERHAEIARIDAQYGRAPHMRRDARIGRADVVLCGHMTFNSFTARPSATRE
jgi:hypothetical protein